MPTPTRARLRSLLRRPAPADPSASRLKAGQRELLARMRSDNEAAGHPFAPTEYWREINARFDEWLRDDGIADVTRQGFNALYASPQRKSAKYHHYALYQLYRQVLAKDAHGVLDRVRAEGSPKLAQEFGPHRVDWDLLISADTLYGLAELEPRVLDGPVVVVDLGAGWGRIGHVLKRVNPQAAYVVLDLPESLLVSEARLTELLPGERVAGYDESRRTESFTREALLAHGGLRFGGPQDLARFEDGAIDVFVNVASFQEMTREQVTAYLGLADRTARHVYLQERWTRASALPEEIIAGWDAYELPERWRRRYLRDVPFTNAFFEAGFDTGQG